MVSPRASPQRTCRTGTRNRDPCGRGPDIEDVVRVVAGRPSIEGEIIATERDIRAFVAAEARRFLASGVTEDVIAGSLPDARDVSGLLDRVRRRFEAIARSDP